MEPERYPPATLAAVRRQPRAAPMAYLCALGTYFAVRGAPGAELVAAEIFRRTKPWPILDFSKLEFSRN